MSASGGSFSNVELNLRDGSRGGRGSYLADLLRLLTGAEDAFVVNNNASAVLLALAATARGQSVPVARGELIEIGGSYRLPEVMTISGAHLVEVGTTNRVRVGDYETALQTHTCSAILKVHPSNYRVEGFTEETSVTELAALAEERDAVLIHDVGSGLLDSDASWLGHPTPPWLDDEPAVRQSLEAGADLVTFSGDKLLGGPQAGIVVGAKDQVEPLRRDPLARALRISGPVEASLAATLESYANGDPDEIPFWRMARTPVEDVASRAERVSGALGGKLVEGESLVGAGSVPGTRIATTQIVLEEEDHLYLPLLRSVTPVATRREDGNLILDLRSVDPADDEVIADMVLKCR
jgi:L-seryl-tRNA(Ser) seleniumtransferase